MLHDLLLLDYWQPGVLVAVLEREIESQVAASAVVGLGCAGVVLQEGKARINMSRLTKTPFHRFSCHILMICGQTTGRNFIKMIPSFMSWWINLHSLAHYSLKACLIKRVCKGSEKVICHNLLLSLSNCLLTYNQDFNENN